MPMWWCNGLFPSMVVLGLHCAPFAHESAGTLESGTVRVSFGHDASDAQTDAFLRTVSKLPRV